MIIFVSILTGVLAARSHVPSPMWKGIIFPPDDFSQPGYCSLNCKQSSPSHPHSSTLYSLPSHLPSPMRRFDDTLQPGHVAVGVIDGWEDGSAVGFALGTGVGL